jgi:zinc protease
MKTLGNLIYRGILIVFTVALPPLAAAIPEIQHWTTENGTQVYFVSAAELPIVDMRIVFDAGSARDREQHGLASLTNALFDSGTEKLSANAVAERLDAVGGQLGSGTTKDMAWLSLRSLSDPAYLTPATDTLAQILMEPSFASESIERERNRMIAAIREKAQSPDTIADQALFRALYGDHPYAFPPEGDEASLKALTREDVQGFYRRYYVAANAVIAIVGDLDRSAAGRLATALIGQLPRGETAPPLPEPKPLSETQLLRISFPSSQAHIRFGQIGISREDPDYYSLYLGNHVLGANGLVSKLAEEIRQKRGLSYSVDSYFLPMHVAGPFVVSLQTRNDQTDEAEQVVKSTLLDFIRQGPSAEALELARKNITGGFALRIDSNSKLVQYAAMIGFYHLPLDYLRAFSARIDNLSLEQVANALRQHIQPQKLVSVVVGGGSADGETQ